MYRLNRMTSILQMSFLNMVIINITTTYIQYTTLVYTRVILHKQAYTCMSVSCFFTTNT